MSVEPDAYATLGVDPGAPARAVSAAYRALARRWHPDGRTPDPVRMIAINQAYNLIKTRELRQRYDESHRLVAVGPGRDTGRWTSRHRPAEAGSSVTTEGPLGRRVAAARARQGEPDAVVDFGIYAGWRVADLARHDPEYLRWLSRHSAGARFREVIARCLPSDPELGRRAKIIG
jgi:curved DNA-binding protein CbpA